MHSQCWNRRKDGEHYVIHKNIDVSHPATISGLKATNHDSAAVTSESLFPVNLGDRTMDRHSHLISFNCERDT